MRARRATAATAPALGKSSPEGEPGPDGDACRSEGEGPMPKAPAERLTSYAERAGVLRAAQRVKMTRSAHAYVRGSTARFYEWLDRQ